jgi:uncharacterized protein (DUF342 family)
MEENNKHALWFVLNEETGDLQANYDPANQVQLNPGMFRQAMSDAGYGEFHLLDGQLNAFLAAVRTSKEILTWLIARREDAELTLTIDDDWMVARLTVVPARGGKPVTMALINEQLREHQISHGILHAEIDAIIATGQCENRTIAQGQFAIEGQPTRFESLLEQKQHELSHIDEMAVVKFRDLSHLLLVEPGDHLMRRHPAIQGKNGINIRGEVAMAPALPELPFATEYPGAKVSESDVNLLVATLAGQPTLCGHGVKVNPVVEVEHVNLKSGNIEFDGTLHVAGDVIAGMRIKVTGDVIIRGTLEAADIICGGNVSVDHGIVGHADTRHGAHGLPPDTARVRCQGSLQAMFVENAHVEAGDSIFIERSARQCELTALNNIVVGKAGSKQSQIVGGTAQAKHLIQALSIGASSGTKTHLRIGHDPYADDEVESKERFLKSKHQELEQVQKLLAFFKQNPKKGEGGVLQKVDGTRAQLIGDIGRGMLELEALREKVALDEDARIEVGNMVYFGTEVKMDNQTWRPNDDMSATIIGWQEGQLMSGIDPVRYHKEHEAAAQKEEQTKTSGSSPQRFG